MKRPSISKCFLQVTVQRYILVTKPHSAKTLASTKPVSKWVAVVLVASIMYSLPFFFKYETVYLKEREYYYFRRAKWSEHKAYDVFYDLLCYFIVLAIVPLGILTCTTFHLIKSLKEAQKKMSAQVAASQ